MHLSRDMATGAALIVAGAAVFTGALGFTSPVGLTYGAGFFPKIVSCGMAISGLLILLGDLRQDRRESFRIVWRDLGRIAVLVLMIAAYALAFDPLGFHIATAGLLFASALYFGAGLRSAVLLALIATCVLHACFYSVMNVSLPWGLLQSVAW